MQYKIGIIGATGYIGAAYRKEIREATCNVQILGLCARRQDRLQLAAAEDNATLVTDDWKQIVDHPDINLVLVLTPDALHYEPVLRCAVRQKHVVCEKPVGLNAQESRDMWEAVRKAKLAHFVPFWTRYVPVFVRARELVQTGRLGAIHSFIYRWHNPRPASMPHTWRDDASQSTAGSLADLGSHVYDTLRWILASDATRVFAYGRSLVPAKPDLGPIDLAEAMAWGQANSPDVRVSTRESSTFDYVALNAEFANGTVGIVVLSHAHPIRKGLCPELELHGTAGSLGVDRISQKLTLVSNDQDDICETVPTSLVNRFQNVVFPALHHRLDENTAAAHPGLDDGHHVQLFLDAAVRSSRGETWCDVSVY